MSAALQRQLVADFPANCAEAKRTGAKRYFTGKPCKHGHVTFRHTLNGTCNDCVLVAIKAWGEANRERRTAKTIEWQRKNPAKVAASIKTWRTKNVEHVKAYDKQYRTVFPGVKRAKEARRRARKAASGGSHTAAEVNALVIRQKRKCVNCSISLLFAYEVDHIMPLVLGGGNSIRNIQILCPSCNAKKHAKHPIVWAQQNGRLL